MKKSAIATFTLILLLSFGFRETDTPKYSDLGEWGINGDVKMMKSLYYYNVKWNDKNLIPINQEQWDRMSLTYYNTEGNMDSLIVYNSTYASAIKFIYDTIGDTSATYIITNNDSVLYSKKYWKSTYDYVVEIFNNNKLATREIYFLDKNFRLKEVKKDQYKLEANSLYFSSIEKMYFNEKNQLDSIRAFTNDKFGDLTVNMDIECDSIGNPLKSIKKVGQSDPYLIFREFIYY